MTVAETKGLEGTSVHVGSLTPKQGAAVRSAPLCFGFPLPRSGYFAASLPELVADNGERIPVEMEPVAFWPDKSVQWVRARGWTTLAAEELLALRLQDPSPSQGDMRVQDPRVSLSEGSLQWTSGGQSFRFTPGTDLLLELPASDIALSLKLDLREKSANVRIDDWRYRELRLRGDAVGLQLTLHGEISADALPTLKMRCELRIPYGDARVDGEITLHNPAAADHPGGLWDLGDRNSALMERLAVEVLWRNAGTRLQGRLSLGDTDGAASPEPMPFSSHVQLTQHASGGQNWNSRVHVDASGEVPLTTPGYALVLDGSESAGSRAHPRITANDGKLELSASIPEFWERFPNALVADADSVRLELLPRTAYLHELQPGERLCKRFTIHVGSDGSAGQSTDCPGLNGIEVHLDPAYVESCGLPGLGNREEIDPRLQAIVDEGLSGAHNFFAKREVADEYGWRNFGDLYADHEADLHSGTELFVSHFNNQYDPLFGFLRQYLLSGEANWLSLADDLAQHVVHTDIYNTTLDRPEYNHGLFWHTDHYAQAETASHRSFSRRHTSKTYATHAGGGGPGGQHCYTTGLLYHYFLTGSEASREALYGLGDWIRTVYEGSNTLAGVVTAVKNRNRPDLKNQLTGRYPLDRGTANYMQSLMDLLLLDHRASHLDALDHIIRGTVHPADYIDARNLGNVEENWYYVVFLQAVCRYLDIRSQHQRLDEDFAYARDALLHYADWMVEHEAPYLDRPDLLEFPNHTWTAQDLRKAGVLLHAGRWSPAGGERYTTKALEFVDYVSGTLESEPTRQYTRILSLLMQNLHPSTPPAQVAQTQAESGSYPAPPASSSVQQLLKLAQMIFRALRHLNLQREWTAWQRILPLPGFLTDRS